MLEGVKEGLPRQDSFPRREVTNAIREGCEKATDRAIENSDFSME
jgi:hypothetical protein